MKWIEYSRLRMMKNETEIVAPQKRILNEQDQSWLWIDASQQELFDKNMKIYYLI